MESIRVLIADDHPFYRDGVRSMLQTVPGFEVEGEAGTGEEVIAKAIMLQPDVVLMDLKMPGINGVEATRRLLHEIPHIKVLVVTMFEDDDSVFAAMRVGARGYLLKDASLDDLVRAVMAVSHGEAIFSPAIAQRLITYFAAPRPAMPSAVFPELTAREREILTMLAQGKSNQEIAAQLVLSLKTVRNHVSNIFSKLEVSDRVHAAMRAREAGMVTDRRGEAPGTPRGYRG